MLTGVTGCLFRDTYQGYPPRPRILFLEVKNKGVNRLLKKESTI